MKSSFKPQFIVKNTSAAKNLYSQLLALKFKKVIIKGPEININMK